MTDHEPTRSRRRRFPFTLCALAGSAIAVPLYFATMSSDSATMSPGDAGSAGVAAGPAPSADASAARTSTPPMAEEAPPGMKAGELSLKLADEAAPMPMRKKAASAPGAPPHDIPVAGGAMPGGGDAKGGLALIGEGGSGARAESAGAVRRDGAERGLFTGRSADELTLPGTKARPEQPQIAAGRLTAGAIDDRKNTELLDELRARATSLDAQLGSALPSHKATGTAPDRDHIASVLEIGLVLDTTGSMGDEIQYLQAEIRSIAQEIANEYPTVTQRYALVAYRDQGDEYVVRGHGFEPLDAFVSHLSAENAGGGGDLPEAMDEAMAAAGDLPWSSGDAARMVFLVADAPAHAWGYSKYARATGSLAAKDVSVYPVASSGVEPICEYLMRWAARTTGGQYLFLTDHSGIGNAHADPHVDQYELKSLRAHMLDMIRDELGAVDGAPGPVAAAPCFYDGRASFWEQHGLFIAALGGVFLLGFAGDMTLATMRRRRARG